MRRFPKKKLEQEAECIIHCTDDTTKLIRPESIESWNTLKIAGELRNHEAILIILEKTKENENPDGVWYHRKCRSIFTLKRDLDKILA